MYISYTDGANVWRILPGEYHVNVSVLYEYAKVGLSG
jgi:hypothetical protein